MILATLILRSLNRPQQCPPMPPSSRIHGSAIFTRNVRWGSSTDGLVNDVGVVEFKNLIAKTMYSLILYTKQNENRTPPGYIPQLQMEMFVAERAYCDIVFYHPDFKPIIHRHLPDMNYHAALGKQIKKVIAERNRIAKVLKPYTNGESK